MLTTHAEILEQGLSEREEHYHNEQEFQDLIRKFQEGEVFPYREQLRKNTGECLERACSTPTDNTDTSCKVATVLWCTNDGVCKFTLVYTPRDTPHPCWMLKMKRMMGGHGANHETVLLMLMCPHAPSAHGCLPTRACALRVVKRALSGAVKRSRPHSMSRISYYFLAIWARLDA